MLVLGAKQAVTENISMINKGAEQLKEKRGGVEFYK
jgi:hypothetical protein